MGHGGLHETSNCSYPEPNDSNPQLSIAFIYDLYQHLLSIPPSGLLRLLFSDH